VTEMESVGLFLLNLIGKFVGSKIVASLALGTIGPTLMNQLVRFLPSYVNGFPRELLDMIVRSSFNNVVLMLVSPRTGFQLVKMSFKCVYLVFKGTKYVVVKIKDAEVISKIEKYMRNVKNEEPKLNIYGDSPLTNFVVNEDYNGENRLEKNIVDIYTNYKKKESTENQETENERLKKYEYISSVLKNKNESENIKDPTVINVTQDEAKKVLKNIEHEKIVLDDKKPQKDIHPLSISEDDEKYPQLLNLLSESITSSWTEVLEVPQVPQEGKEIYNNFPKYPISPEDSWIKVDPTAPPI